MTKEAMVHLLKTNKIGWNLWRRSEPLEQIDLIAPELRGADLRDVDLRGARLIGAKLNGANLTDARFDDADLSLADLSESELRGASFQRAKLKGADISDADLNAVDLSGADLTGASLMGTDLLAARFVATNLSKTVLLNTTFAGTDLVDTDFSGAKLGITSFNNVDMSRVRGLESVTHSAASTIGTDTIYRSQGRIPESFLRDAGIPEGFITQIAALINAQEGIQFYSCFISYSSKDDEFARRLHSRMRDAKLRVWFAPKDMRGGRKSHEQIETQIQVHDKLLLLLSEASMESEWVATEIYHGRQREVRENRQILFPVRLCTIAEIKKWKSFDSDTGKDMAREIREYHLPDFSNWKDHDRFEAEFKNLLRDLKADTQLSGG